MASEHRAQRYRSLYGKLLRLYPARYRQRFGESMQQTFSDLCDARKDGAGITLGFALWAFGDTFAGMIKEHLAEDHMKTIGMNPRLAALFGFLLILPFLVMNGIVGNRVEPFISLLRPDGHTSRIEIALLAIVLLLFPIGAFIAFRPVLRKGADGNRRVYPLNVATATLLLVVFGVLIIGIGEEIYRCDVLGIPNCD